MVGQEVAKWCALSVERRGGLCIQCASSWNTVSVTRMAVPMACKWNVVGCYWRRLTWWGAEKDCVSVAEKDIDCADAFHRVELSADSKKLPAYTRKPKAEQKCEMERLGEFLAGLETTQRHITDVGASGEAEADAQVAGSRVRRGQEIAIEPAVPMDHRMEGDRTIQQVEAAETFSTFMWEQEHVEDASEGASTEGIKTTHEARMALPLNFKDSAGAWWK